MAQASITTAAQKPTITSGLMQHPGSRAQQVALQRPALHSAACAWRAQRALQIMSAHQSAQTHYHLRQQRQQKLHQQPGQCIAPLSLGRGSAHCQHMLPHAFSQSADFSAFGGDWQQQWQPNVQQAEPVAAQVVAQAADEDDTPGEMHAVDTAIRANTLIFIAKVVVAAISSSS